MSASYALLIDDHPLYLNALAEQLRKIRPQFEITTAADGVSARTAFGKQTFKLVIIDLSLPDEPGLDLLRELVQQNTQGDRLPTSRFAVLSASERLMDVYNALQAGAQGYIVKSISNERLRLALENILAGHRVTPDDYQEARIAALRALTARQLEVLGLLNEGLTNQRIAARLQLSPETVKSHLRVLFETLNVNSRTGCISSARDSGLL